MKQKIKYVRLGRYDEFIFFPGTIEHKTFKHLNPISAGFCSFHTPNEVCCYGDSFSLGLKSMEDDTKLATKQMYGIDAMFDLENKKK